MLRCDPGTVPQASLPSRCDENRSTKAPRVKGKERAAVQCPQQHHVMGKVDLLSMVIVIYSSLQILLSY
jgi:hypothetical protein